MRTHRSQRTTGRTRAGGLGPAMLWMVAYGGSPFTVVGCVPVRSPIEWSGVLVDDPLLVGNVQPLATAQVSAHSPNGALLDTGRAMPDAPGAALLRLPADTPVELRVAAQGYTTSVWPTRTPVGDAAWLDGALYPRADAVLALLRDTHLDGLALPNEAGTAAIWMEPTTETAGSWQPITITDDAGVPIDTAAQQVALQSTPTGRWIRVDNADADVILVLDLTPGRLHVVLHGAQGADQAIALNLQGGELGMLPRLRPAED